MNVRRLSAKDAEQYWDLRLEALKTNPEEFITTYEEAMKREKPIERTAENLSSESAHTFGAFLEGKLQGVVTLVPGTHEKFQHKADIFAMYVSPNSRGNGIGKRLIQACIDQAKDIHVEQINLTVVSSNNLGIRLYQSMGFEKYGFEKNAIKLGKQHYLDEDLMVLHL